METPKLERRQDFPRSLVDSKEPLSAFYGHHRCASAWVQKIVHDVCAIAGLKIFASHSDQCFRGDILRHREQDPFDFWCYTNAECCYIRSLRTIGFHVVRDPRDVIVSAYFSHLQGRSVDIWPKLRFFAPYLRSLSKDEGLMKEIEFIGPVMSQMLIWDYTRPSILELRFEDLVRYPLPLFARIFHHLGITPQKVGQEALPSIILRHSPEEPSGERRPGSEVRENRRRGEHGNWRNHFTSRHVAYFKSLYNPLLLKLGYEESEDWH